MKKKIKYWVLPFIGMMITIIIVGMLAHIANIGDWYTGYFQGMLGISVAFIIQDELKK